MGHNISVKRNTFLFPAIIFSFILHFIFLSAFVLTVPARAQPFRPSLYFLGSFLRYQNMLVSPLRKEDAGSAREDQDALFNKNAQTLKPDIQFDKPVAGVIKTKKITTKSTFPIAKPASPPSDDLPITTESVYKPLRLDLHD